MKENWYHSFCRWFAGDDRTEIMLVHYCTITNTVRCEDWYSQVIWKFTGAFTPELWKEIKSFCRFPDNPRLVPTRIYISAGAEKKFLAYCEPIEPYFKNETLLQTGQGFHYGSGKQHPQPPRNQCPSCGHPLPLEY